MPTATEFFGYSAHNLGPLTTTFTAPSSCATNNDHILFANATSPYLPYAMSSSCSAEPFDDCYPSGKEWYTDSTQTTEFIQGLYQYFSPGIACPAGWKTVGTMKHGSKGGEIDVSGALTVSPSWLTYAEANTLQPTDFWRNVLDKSETLAYCCPSGYDGDVYGFCKSTLGQLKPTKSNDPHPRYCAVYADYEAIVTSVEGVTQTKGVRSAVPVTANTTTTSVLLGLWGDDYLEHFAYATWVPAVTLINKGDDEDKSESEGGKADESAASSVRRGDVVSVLGVTVGFLAGVGMLMAW